MFMQTDSDNRTRLSLLHIEALQKRGLTNASIDAAGFCSLSAEQVLAILKFNLNKSDGLGIPFLHPITGETRLVRVRPDIAPVIDGKPAKYLSPKGSGNLLYFPPGCADRLKDSDEPLYITEGEFKALAAWQAGLLTIGLIGVSGWKGKQLSSHSQPIPDLDLIAWRERTVVIVFDSDAAINPEVLRARLALAREAYRRSARIVYSINLPAPDGIKVGWDDYLQSRGLDAFSDLDAEEIPSPYPPVKVWTLAELRTANLERPAPIVPGWGIRRGGKVIVTGAGGRGKSTLLLQLACHFAAGTSILQHPQLTISAPQRVFIYMAEDPLAEVRFRLLRQVEELDYSKEAEELIQVLDFCDRPPQVLTDEWALRTLADRIRQHRATICILDPLVSLHDRDENSNPQMRAVLDAVTPIAEETGCTFIIAHHEPKNPENNGAAARGASAIRDWCRTMLRLTSHGESDGRVRRYTLALDKANYGGSVWNLPLEREEDRYTFRLAEEMETVTPLQVWEAIGSEERWLSEVLAELMRAYSVSEATAARAVKKAEKLFLAVIGEKANPTTGRMKKTLRRGNGEETADAE